jgi:hypothetical protein
MPNGTRINEPLKTGIAVSSPNSVAFKPSVFFSGIPMTANIIHTMKHTVKARVLTMSTDQALRELFNSEAILLSPKVWLYYRRS